MDKKFKMPVGYAAIPLALIKDKTLTPHAKVIYAYIWYLRNVLKHEPVSKLAIARDLDFDIPRTSTLINKLVAKKWLKPIVPRTSEARFQKELSEVEAMIASDALTM